MSDIKILPAEIADAAMLKQISVNAFTSNYEKYGHYPPGIESLDWHKDKIDKGLYYKIKFDQKIVGGVYIALHSDSEMKIEYLFISPNSQGKKLGTAAMVFIEDKHKEITKWFLFTPYKDFRNHHFYAKLGYKKTGEVRPSESSEFKLFKYEKLIK